MNKEALLKQIKKVNDELWLLEDMVSDDDEEKQRISMLVSGTPDLHVRNPEQYEKMAPYADESKPPFTDESWMMLGLTGKDPRLTFAQIDEFKRMFGDKP